MRSQIYFHDLALLSAIHGEEVSKEAPVRITKVKELGNAWLKEREVPIYYATNFNSDQQRQISIAVLRKLGLIEHVSDRGGFHVTDDGVKMLKELTGNWRNWALVAPIMGNKIDWSQGKLAQDFRREL